MPSASAYSNNFNDIWHKILGNIWFDQGEKQKATWTEYLDEDETDKKYYDDVEVVDPGLWSETEEGSDLHLDDFGQGVRTRYEPKKFSKKLVIPEELEEDGQYAEAYNATRMLRNTCTKTEDYDAVGLLNNAFDTNFVFGDGQVMCGTSHPIRGGGTISNTFATALSPSNTAVATMLIQCEKMPGTNGFRYGVMLKKIVCPTDLKFRFREVLKSSQKDDTANNAVNALKGDLQSEPVSVPYMSSTTNWFGKTDAMQGGRFVWRRRPRFRRTNDINNETKIFTGSARWIVGFSNFRWTVGVNA